MSLILVPSICIFMSVFVQEAFRCLLNGYFNSNSHNDGTDHYAATLDRHLRIVLVMDFTID